MLFIKDGHSIRSIIVRMLNEYVVNTFIQLSIALWEIVLFEAKNMWSNNVIFPILLLIQQKKNTQDVWYIFWETNTYFFQQSFLKTV